MEQEFSVIYNQIDVDYKAELMTFLNEFPANIAYLRGDGDTGEQMTKTVVLPGAESDPLMLVSNSPQHVEVVRGEESTRETYRYDSGVLSYGAADEQRVYDEPNLEAIRVAELLRIVILRASDVL